MMINIVPAISTFSISDVMSWSTVSALFIAVSLVTILLSRYRYLLVYLFGGMAYWLLIEGVQSTVVTLFPNAFASNIWQSYVVALSFTWLIPSAFLTYRYINLPTSSAPHLTQADTYKEHTPIYNNYKPRFHN